MLINLNLNVLKERILVRKLCLEELNFIRMSTCDLQVACLRNLM